LWSGKVSIPTGEDIAFKDVKEGESGNEGRGRQNTQEDLKKGDISSKQLCHAPPQGRGKQGRVREQALEPHFLRFVKEEELGVEGACPYHQRGGSQKIDNF